jgi:hypothetical protein
MVVNDIGGHFAQPNFSSRKARSGAMLREMAPAWRGFDQIRETQRAQAELNRLFGGLRFFRRLNFRL